MATSRVPAAIDALLAILDAAPGLDGVKVVDGPVSIDFTERQVLYVGWQPDGESAVTLTQDFADAGARRRDEDFVIGCYAESRSGDKGAAKLHRDRVFAIVAVVETALRATNDAPDAPTLNGTVQWAHVTAGDLSQRQDAGTIAGLQFFVTCRARL
ncbi:hypothetical protein ABZ883_26440 [Streptomyces sp. NPDC046977]|uniref:hypothetical protein n=1 Tax=Streptomyces sp. NPDC046977 TaxID=3154703 RepID=UPI00340578DB